MFTLEKKNEIFDQYLPSFIENGGIPSRSDQIWPTIKLAHNLPKEVTVASLYTAMSKKFSDSVQKEKTAPMNSSNEEKSTDANKSSDSIVFSEEEHSIENIEVPVKKFHINISATNWKRIQPVSAIYHRIEDNEHRKIDRKYNILPPGVWTYVLSRAIGRGRKNVPCRWIFRRCKVNSQKKS